MNTTHKIAAALALAATVGLGALAAPPAGAQRFYPYGYHRHYYRPHQYRHANRLDRRAGVAASHGRFYRASRLSNHAAAIRSAARHGY